MIYVHFKNHLFLILPVQELVHTIMQDYNNDYKIDFFKLIAPIKH